MSDNKRFSFYSGAIMRGIMSLDELTKRVWLINEYPGVTCRVNGELKEDRIPDERMRKFLECLYLQAIHGRFYFSTVHILYSHQEHAFISSGVFSFLFFSFLFFSFFLSYNLFSPKSKFILNSSFYHVNSYFLKIVLKLEGDYPWHSG